MGGWLAMGGWLWVGGYGWVVGGWWVGWVSGFDKKKLWSLKEKIDVDL